MAYEVIEDFYSNEFDVTLAAGNSVEDGDYEPDLIANLVVAGILQAPDAPAPKKARKSSK